MKLYDLMRSAHNVHKRSRPRRKCEVATYICADSLLKHIAFAGTLGNRNRQLLIGKRYAVMNICDSRNVAHFFARSSAVDACGHMFMKRLEHVLQVVHSKSSDIQEVYNVG